MEARPGNVVLLPSPPGVRRAPSRPRRRSDDDEEGWLISYSDMISQLVCFLLVVLSASQLDVNKMDSLKSQIEQRFGDQDEQPSQLEILESRVQAVLSKGGWGPNIRTRHTERGLQIELNARLLFAEGSADLNTGAMDLLDRLVGPLVGLPIRVEVEGHTDPVPIRSGRFPSNWELSSARASSVVRYLITAVKFQPSRLKAVGLADTFPLTEQGDALSEPPPRQEWTEAYLSRQRRVALLISPASSPAVQPGGLQAMRPSVGDQLYFGLESPSDGVPSIGAEAVEAARQSQEALRTGRRAGPSSPQPAPSGR